jgi:hypothetical protein
MAQRKTLTEAQVGVLRWIGDGCPEGVMKDDFHRISAAALARRGLVEVDGRRESWSAQITDAGRAYLEKVDGPEPLIPRQGNTSVTQQLVDEVIDAGGTLRLPRNWYGRGVDYRNRALLAERHRKVPPGKRLAVKAISDEELEIELVDAPGLGEAKLVEVEVPERVSRYHPAAKRFRDGKKSHEVSKAQLPRAARIVHALAREAERRDWSLQTVGDPQADAGGRAVLRIDVSGQAFSLFIYEKGVDNRGEWEAAKERYDRHAREWPGYGGERPPRSYDCDAEGELTLALACERDWRFRARQSRWSDRSSWTLEERLPHLFVEIEERALEGARIDEEERRVAEAEAARQEREKAEREEQWKKLMVRAQDRVIESHRAAQLRSRLDASDEAQRIRRYCEAMDATAADSEETAAWLTWAREYANKIDPIGVPTSLPEDPDLTHEAVQQHLPSGWSTYGPEQGWQPRRTPRSS